METRADETRTGGAGRRVEAAERPKGALELEHAFGLGEGLGGGLNMLSDWEKDSEEGSEKDSEEGSEEMDSEKDSEARER